MTRAPRTPSIRTRLASALLVWSVAWGLAVGAAIWLAASHEVEELLDDTLQDSTALLAMLIDEGLVPTANGAATAIPSPASQRFAWQLVAADGHVVARSPRAPEQPWHAAARPGFSLTPEWRIHGLAIGSQGRMLYAAQTRDERLEARSEVALSATLAAFAVGLLGHLWLRSRVRAELQPLQDLSDTLVGVDMNRLEAGQPGLLEPATRKELAPVHDAVNALTHRLAERLASEKAFAAHAAHSLRTPLAGIDAQLAVALRECPPELRERLSLVRGAAGRLQSVVVALLGLFRAANRATVAPVDLAVLVDRLPAPGLQVQVTAAQAVHADADLLAAALLNLLDNAQRHGARQVRIDAPSPRLIRVADDGPGVDAARRAALREALRRQDTEGVTGLGLMLAERVARAHGGSLSLPDSETGFVVELDLGGPQARAA